MQAPGGRIVVNPTFKDWEYEDGKSTRATSMNPITGLVTYACSRKNEPFCNNEWSMEAERLRHWYRSRESKTWSRTKSRSTDDIKLCLFDVHHCSCTFNIDVVWENWPSIWMFYNRRSVGKTVCYWQAAGMQYIMSLLFWIRIWISVIIERNVKIK